MKTTILLTLSIFCGMMACKNDVITADLSAHESQEATSRQNTRAAAAKPPVVTSYLTGSSTDVTTTTQGGLLLMGGSTDVDAAIAWFLQRSGGGDVVVIRATGADGYNTYMYNMVPVNSVETLIIDSREKAALPSV